MLSLLAQAAPTATPSFTVSLDDPRALLVLLALGLPLLVTTVSGVLGIVKHFRSDPPVHKEYATKAELKEVELRLEGAISTDAEALKEMEGRSHQSLTSMEHRLKTEISSVDEGFQRGNTALQNELKAIHRTLGQIEGEVKNRRRA